MSNNENWEKFRLLTSARIGLGKSGSSLMTNELLRFREDHALAKDAVWAELDREVISVKLDEMGLQSLLLNSQAIDRQTFIKRPDLGRKLSVKSANKLEKEIASTFDLSISIAGGLSPLAIERHAINFLRTLFPMIAHYTIAPVAVINEGRVAISDEVGQLCRSKLAIILIGERPGLTSPDSMGVYMTYDPKIGNTDERRNCISNIRNGGLSYEFAASKLSFLINESMRRKLSGVDLKDTLDYKQLQKNAG